MVSPDAVVPLLPNKKKQLLSEAEISRYKWQSWLMGFSLGSLSPVGVVAALVVSKPSIQNGGGNHIFAMGVMWCCFLSATSFVTEYLFLSRIVEKNANGTKRGYLVIVLKGLVLRSSLAFLLGAMISWTLCLYFEVHAGNSLVLGSGVFFSLCHLLPLWFVNSEERRLRNNGEGAEDEEDEDFFGL